MSLKLRPGVFAATRYRRLVFSFHSQLRCSMELNAVSVAPWVGHVVVPGARISGFAYEWVSFRGGEGCLQVIVYSLLLTIVLWLWRGVLQPR